MVQHPYPDTQTYQADVLLITVTEIETMAVRRLFSNVQKHFIGDKTYYDLGEVSGTKVFLVQSEMGVGGQGGAMRTIEKGIAVLSPSAVIMVGIAFGIEPSKQRIGDILVSQQILDYELQRVGSGVNGEFMLTSRGDKAAASPRLLNRFRDGAMEWTEANEQAKVKFGLILSGAKLVDNQDFREQLQTFGPEAIGGEMEGAGLYAAAQGNKVDWILIKAICDWADGNKADDKQTYQELAAANVARFVLHVINQGGLRGNGSRATLRGHKHDASSQIAQQETQSSVPSGSSGAAKFDVFLCHNSRDKQEVKEIGRKLQQKGIKPWLDEWDVRPGEAWQRVLEKQIPLVKSAAVFIGAHGMAGWQWLEEEAFLREFVSRNCPVIPVFLMNAPQEPDIPLFLRGMSWVDFRKQVPDPLSYLIWGITGNEEKRANASPKPMKPTDITYVYTPSREGNKGIATFFLNGTQHTLEYIRYDKLSHQIIFLKRGNQELVREKVPFATLKTVERKTQFQIDGVDCLFTFRMQAITGIMSVKLVVGGVEIIHG